MLFDSSEPEFESRFSEAQIASKKVLHGRAYDFEHAKPLVSVVVQ